jgi:putative transposase
LWLFCFMELYKDKYKTQSTRLQGYDYTQNGMYFVTICTKDRECYLGEVVKGEMILNEMGKIAENFWKEIPDHFSNVRLDEFVVMPNHIHGLIEIVCDIDARRDEALPRLYTGEYPRMSEMSPMPGSLSVILGSYKSIVTKTVRKKISYILFSWQSRYYDHIIRNENKLNKIHEYIINNPEMWERDRNLPAGEAGNLENLYI